MQVCLRRLAAWAGPVAILLLAGCSRPASAPPPHPLLALEGAEDAQVREVVFRHLLKNHPKDAVAFLSFGQTEGRWIDPPETFYAHLADTGLMLGTASQAVYPKLGQMNTDGTPGGIIDRRTKRPGYLYYVKIVRWGDAEDRGADAATVEAGRYAGQVSGHGFKTVVRKDASGKWIMEPPSLTW